MVLATAAAVLMQLPAWQPQLDRIAWAQVVMAVGMGVVTLCVLGMALTAFMVYRSVRRLLRTAEEQLRSLTPRAEPILFAANRIATDATGLSKAARKQADELLGTVEELNEKLRHLSREAEDRVREFGAVLDVVQGEAREILLDAAATARGVHATAEALQAARASALARHRE